MDMRKKFPVVMESLLEPGQKQQLKQQKEIANKQIILDTQGPIKILISKEIEYQEKYY